MILIAFMVFVMTVIVCGAGGEPSVEVKGFSANERTSLSSDIKNRTWTEVRSSLYDREGGTRFFIVLPPSNQAGAGVVETGFTDYPAWKDIAEKDGAILILPDPGADATWNASDLACLEAIYTHCHGYVLEGASRYIAAYGDAGIPVSLFAVKHTDWIAGAAFIRADIAAIGDPGTIKSNLPLSVQIINTTCKNTTILTEYFKAANGADQAKHADANETVYYKSGSSAWNSDYSKSHFVQVINNRSNGFPSFIYNNLFRAVARWKTISAEGTLRAKVRAGDIAGFEKIAEKGNPGRDAFVYVPSAVRNGAVAGPVPMVMLFHGRRCNGEYFMDQTEWFRTAEQNDFIVYAPNGLVYNWNIDNKESIPDDYAYFSNRIAGFIASGIAVGERTYPVDAARIYVFGFSNGSFFSSQLIMKYPEKIAAAALWAGGSNPSIVKDKAEQALPVWYGIGSADNYYNEWKKDGEAMIGYFIDLAGANPKNKTTTYYPAFGIANLIKTDIYTGGSVEIRQSEAANIIHGIINEYPNHIWNDFFSKYKKQEGKSVPASTANAALRGNPISE